MDLNFGGLGLYFVVNTLSHDNDSGERSRAHGLFL